MTAAPDERHGDERPPSTQTIHIPQKFIAIHQDGFPSRLSRMNVALATRVGGARRVLVRREGAGSRAKVQRGARVNPCLRARQFKQSDSAALNRHARLAYWRLQAEALKLSCDSHQPICQSGASLARETRCSR
ncbi:hypothetical protein SKAU_G00134930 [Synaphobranchus kaupii]|uniref:Uncharacterized protein n=1 Tax=Synaphobranchus kaupii TaxID=118154 RepID=A0A9Q1FS59_SYNKA|nr:hypothetical protein SKAU_G00134930 [Synaphobranchus kaupii]